MIGTGRTTPPPSQQADVGVAMSSGTQVAREAGNMVDLDSNPTKLIDIVETGQGTAHDPGALTTFSIANDVAKFFAILPAMFVTLYASAREMTARSGPQHHAPRVSAERDPLRGHLQTPSSSSPSSRWRSAACATVRGCGAHPAPQSSHLRPGRDRGALHRHQSSSISWSTASGSRERRTTVKPIRTALIVFAFWTVVPAASIRSS